MVALGVAERYGAVLSVGLGLQKGYIICQHLHADANQSEHPICSHASRAFLSLCCHVDCGCCCRCCCWCSVFVYAGGVRNWQFSLAVQAYPAYQQVRLQCLMPGCPALASQLQQLKGLVCSGMFSCTRQASSAALTTEPASQVC